MELNQYDAAKGGDTIDWHAHRRNEGGAVVMLAGVSYAGTHEGVELERHQPSQLRAELPA